MLETDLDIESKINPEIFADYQEYFQRVNDIFMENGKLRFSDDPEKQKELHDEVNEFQMKLKELYGIEELRTTGRLLALVQGKPAEILSKKDVPGDLIASFVQKIEDKYGIGAEAEEIAA